MPEIKFDADADAMYITLRQGTVARTQELNDGVLVDLDAQGVALGIEVISPRLAPGRGPLFIRSSE